MLSGVQVSDDVYLRLYCPPALRYPCMYTAHKQAKFGDNGWNVSGNEHAFAHQKAAAGMLHYSAIAERRHNRRNGISLTEGDLQARHNFMRLPGMHSHAFLNAYSGSLPGSGK